MGTWDSTGYTRIGEKNKGEGEDGRKISQRGNFFFCIECPECPEWARPDRTNLLFPILPYQRKTQTNLAGQTFPFPFSLFPLSAHQPPFFLPLPPRPLTPPPFFTHSPPRPGTRDPGHGNSKNPRYFGQGRRVSRERGGETVGVGERKKSGRG